MIRRIALVASVVSAHCVLWSATARASPAEPKFRRGGEPTQLPNLASELSPVRLGVREDTRRRIWIPERDQLDSPLTEIGGQH